MEPEVDDAGSISKMVEKLELRGILKKMAVIVILTVDL